MPVRVFSAAIQGIDAKLVEVEVDSAPGIFSFNIVGLPDTAVKESQSRIGSAIRNSGFSAPNTKNKKIIVNLAPADLKKEGPAYDLPIALAFLLETGQLKGFSDTDTILAGELSLNGNLKHTSGILAVTIMAKNKGFKEIIIPRVNAKEASMVEGIKVIGASTLSDVVAHLNRSHVISPHEVTEPENTPWEADSFAMIKGQEFAKRALAVAAAGGHNLIMSGPPGSGKTLLAKSLCDLLTSLTTREAIEVAKIYSSIGLIKNSPLSLKRPFRNPHHTTSAVAIVGGGTNPKPGEISLAHRGVLFLDEIPEFPRSVLEALRQPLEDGTVTVSRASGTATLPAKFMLIAAMNPCPCGNFGDEKAVCICSPINILKYKKRISGPILDRIDIQITVPRETLDEASKPIDGDATKRLENIRFNIEKARKIQEKRFKNSSIFTNSEMSYKNIDKYCNLEKSADALLKRVINSKNLSLRSYHKILKVSQTIADLEGANMVKESHVAEALSLRLNEALSTELI